MDIQLNLYHSANCANALCVTYFTKMQKQWSLYVV